MSLLLRRILRAGSPAPPPSGSSLLSELLPFLSAGDPLVIGVGTTVTVDLAMIDADRLGTVTVNGTLDFSTAIDTRILADSILNYGTIIAGSSGTPHPTNITIDLCGARPTVNGFSPAERTALGIGSGLITGPTHTINVSTGNNGIQNDNNGVSRAFINDMGGVLKLYGSQAPAVRRLNAHYASGTTVTVDSAVTAPAGATVLVTPSGFYNAAARTEIRTLAAPAVASTTLTLNSALGYTRWGALQYMTDAGPSLTADTFSQISGGNPTGMRTDATQDPVLDERAFVVVLAPTIKIKGYDAGNTDLATFGYGFHGMSMGLTSQTVLKNVGFEQYGQKGLLGRYGWHFHRGSYNDDGTATTDGDAGTNVFPADYAVLDGVTGMFGHNRFATLHAVRGAVVQNCIGYDALGHCFFEEDGAEEDCTISNCLAIAHRIPSAGDRLKVKDAQPAGFWFANPNNTHTENWGIDSEGRPWWNAHSQGIIATRPSIQHGCLGQSALVPISPLFGKMGTWDGNSGLSCAMQALSDNGVTDNAGNNGSLMKIKATTDGVAYAAFSNPATDTPIVLENMRLFKLPGYGNTVADPRYVNARMADINGIGFSGITDFGNATAAIVIRETLNHESHVIDATMCNACIPYHGTLTFPKLCAWGYKGQTPAPTPLIHNLVQKQCVMQSWEEYTAPIHQYSVVNSGWAIGDSDGYWQVPPPHLTEGTTTYDAYTGTAAGGAKFMDQTSGVHRRWTFGMQYDCYGTMGKGPTTLPQPNTHIVFNQPFFTTGLTVTPLENNAESCWTTTPFMGLQLATGTPAQQAHRFQRVDSSRVDIAGAIWEMPISLNNGNTPPDYGTFFHNFHSGACPINGYVKLTFPGAALPNTFLTGNQYCSGPQNIASGGIYAAPNPYLTVNDWTVWGIQWDGATAVAGAYINSGTALALVASFAALQAHAGNCYWQDTAADLVWIKIKPWITSYQWRIYAAGFA